MFITGVVFVVSFTVAAVTTQLLRPVAARLGLVDEPDGQRKQHAEATPLVGGLGVLAGLGAAALCGLAFGRLGLPQTGAVFLAAVPIVAVGLWDDRASSPTWVRLIAQFMCALIMVYQGGVVVRDLGDLTGTGQHVELGYLAVPFTVFCIVGALNAVNMIDGLDGLAGGVVLVALGWYGVVGATQGALFETLLALTSMGAIGGFLLFNWRTPFKRRAAVFLGDTGSMLLGMILVWLTISLTQGTGRTFAPMMAVWVLGLPLLDTLSVIVVRLLQRRSPLSCDRNHLHHRLLRAGFSDRQVTALLLLCACGFGAIGVGAWHLGVSETVLFYGSFSVYVVYLAVILAAKREPLLNLLTRLRDPVALHQR